MSYLHMSSFVMATAMSYTGSLRSRKRYLPMSVRADAASMASRPTLFLSRYGVASRPCKYRDVTKIFTEIFFWILEIINPGQFVSIKLKDTEMHIKYVNKYFSLLAGTLDCSASVLQAIKTDQKYFK